MLEQFPKQDPGPDQRGLHVHDPEIMEMKIELDELKRRQEGGDATVMNRIRELTERLRKFLGTERK